MTFSPQLELSFLHHPDQVFHNNETITGAVKFKTTTTLTAYRILVVFVGQERVALTVNTSSDRCLKKVYFRQELVLWGDQLGTQENTIQPGTHCFPFTCQLSSMSYPGSTSSGNVVDATCPEFIIEYVFQAAVECRETNVISPLVPIQYEPVIWPQVQFNRQTTKGLESEAHFLEETMLDQDGKETSYVVRAMFSQVEYLPGETVQVELEVGHKSGSTRVMEALCSVQETIECHLDGLYPRTSTQDRPHQPTSSTFHHPNHRAVWTHHRKLGFDYPEALEVPRPTQNISPMKARRRALSNAASSLLTMRNPSLDLHTNPDRASGNVFSSSHVVERPYRCVARIKLSQDTRPLCGAHVSFGYSLVVDVKVPGGYFKRKSVKMVRAILPIRVATVNKEIAKVVARVRNPCLAEEGPHPQKRQQHHHPRLAPNRSHRVIPHTTQFSDLPPVLQTPMELELGLNHSILDREQPYLAFSNEDPSLWVPMVSARIISIHEAGFLNTCNLKGTHPPNHHTPLYSNLMYQSDSSESSSIPSTPPAYKTRQESPFQQYNIPTHGQMLNTKSSHLYVC
ncbi:hypothetical protein IWQ61_006183 [Dispira simplex]|nr:hypothetical protein IWQ61_006183 [Dispira simplex]